MRWVERRDDPAQAWSALRTAERRRMSGACASRRREFATARMCAREALAAIGRPAAEVGRGHCGQPLWPDGIVGSITHCAGLRAAAVGSGEQYLGLGIDAEPDEPLPRGVAEFVLRPDETERLASTGRWPVHTDRLVFCVKEAAYKIWSQLPVGRIGFHDASVTLHADGGFAVRLLVPGPVVDGLSRQLITGRWGCPDGTIRVAAVLARPQPGCQVQ